MPDPRSAIVGLGCSPGPATLREQLSHVRWIGGGSGAGKTTIARRIAADRGLRLYSTDDAMRDHGRRSSPSDAPYLSRFIAMDMDERWVTRTPEVMLDTFHWYRGEGFGLIVEDSSATGCSPSGCAPTPAGSA